MRARTHIHMETLSPRRWPRSQGGDLKNTKGAGSTAGFRLGKWLGADKPPGQKPLRQNPLNDTTSSRKKQIRSIGLY